jgi:hypothetical protein
MRDNTELEAMLKHLQAGLWEELNRALYNAINGTWSVGCDSVVAKIAPVARMVGPTEPSKVHWKILAGGLYEAILVKAGVEVPEFDLSDEYWQLMYKYGQPEELRMRLHMSVIMMERGWDEDSMNDWREYL